MKKIGNLDIISIKTENNNNSIYGQEHHTIVVDHELNEAEINVLKNNLYFGPEISSIKKNENETWTYIVSCYKD